ncbi:hypothetical protein, partial [Mycobacterium sp.]|uniref:hypothetical protein n=1 Tax=Mycobacterium sp. TaxID=1785 RepID=UPI003A83B353
MNRPSRVVLIALGSALALALAGCSGGSSSNTDEAGPGGDQPRTLNIAARPGTYAGAAIARRSEDGYFA